MAKLNLTEEKRSLSIEEKVEEETQRKLQEKKLQQSKKNLDTRIKKLEEDMLKNSQLYGLEDLRTRMSISMYDISVKMKDYLETIEQVTTAMSYISETLSFMDEALKLQDDLIQDTLKTNYNVFYRIKMAFKLSKFKRNIKRRFKVFSSQIRAISNVPNILESTLAKAMGDMGKPTGKKKKGDSVAPIDSNSPGLKKIMEAKESGTINIENKDSVSSAPSNSKDDVPESEIFK